MKILFLSNYSPWLNIAKGKMPSHHLFGVMEMIDHFVTPSSAVLKPKWGGTIDFINVGSISKIELVKLYLNTYKYDVVYDVLNCVSKYFGVINKYHLFKPKLITIYHHPPFGKVMKYAKSDCSVFFEEHLMQEAKTFVSDDRILKVNEWYPDKAWYDTNKATMDNNIKYDFLDNGKTSRDHNLFIRCMRLMPDKKAVIVTDKKHIPLEYKEGENVTLFLQEKPNDLTMLQLCLNSKVMVIPLEETNNMQTLGPIGATSFMDAIALGMPVVTNRKAAFANEIRKDNLGVLFEMNESSLSMALRESLNKYDDYHHNMMSFSLSHTVELYSKKFMAYL